MRRALRALAVVLAAALIGLAARQWRIGAVRIAGVSMADTLRDGDIALVTKLDYRIGEPARGDIVVCAFDGREDTYVKRRDRVLRGPADRQWTACLRTLRLVAHR